MALTEADSPETPDWWLLRLGRRMRDREKRLNFWKGYYRGDGQLLPQGPAAAGRVYLDFQRKSRTNFCMLPVEADVHRLLAIGVADGNGEPLGDVWKWWQLNRLDAKQKQVYRTALSLAESYVSVGVHPRDKKRPLIVPEHPRQVIVESDPGTGERRAGLKAFYDDVKGYARAFVDTGQVIVEYRTEERSGKARLPWGENSWTIVRAIPNPAKRVSYVPFTYQPDLEDDPVPVFAPIIDIQDRINFSVLNRMTAERYGAFRQRWFVGDNIPKKWDEETGLELPVNPWKPDPGGTWVHESEDGQKGQFGEFSQTDLLGYLKVNETDIRTSFVITSTPAYYMPQDLINIATDTVMALDTNHVAKVGEEQGEFSESWEDVIQLAAAYVGFDGLDLSDAEMRWKDPRSLNPAVLADMAVKKHSINWPTSMLAEDLGESPQRVKRLRSEMAAQEMRARALANRPASAQQPNTPQFRPPAPSEAA